MIHETLAEIPCDECGRAWQIVGGITRDDVGWIEGTAAHECDGIGVLGAFRRDTEGRLVITETISFEERADNACDDDRDDDENGGAA